MRKYLTLLIKNYQSHSPPDESEVKVFLEELGNPDSWTDVKLPSEIEGCLAFLCSRQALKDLDLRKNPTFKSFITWLVRATLSEISRASLTSLNDPLHGLRVLLSENPVPQKLCESEFQKLLATCGEVDISVAATVTTSKPPKKKVKKAQIAKELWEDISSEVLEISGDHTSRLPVTYLSVARAVFWDENGNEILLNCLQSFLKNIQNFNEVDLPLVAKNAFLICQILHGSISDPVNLSYTLSSLPTMFVNNWIKTIFMLMTYMVQSLVPSLCTRDPRSFQNTAVSSDLSDNMVLLQESFFSLSSSSDKRQSECFERDAAHLWFNLRLVSAFCMPSPEASSDAPLKLRSSLVTSFIKFTSFALKSLHDELQGSSASTSSIIVNRLPWSREDKGALTMDSDTLATHPLEWIRALSALDAYERFILEAEFRRSLIFFGPLDLFLLDLASAFFTAAIDAKPKSAADHAALLACTEDAVRALSSLLQLRVMHHTPSIVSDKDAFVKRLVNFIALPPESLGLCLTGLFCVLAPTPLAPLALSQLHLLPHDPHFCVNPPSLTSFRFLATYLLDASCSQPDVIETYCNAAVGSNFSDLPPQMAQLISLLSAAFPSHTSKKTFLSAIIDALVGPNGVTVLGSLRLTVLLRFQLHYIFDPPLHLNAQVRPAILGAEKLASWEFANLAGRGRSEGFFYDLLQDRNRASSPASSSPSSQASSVPPQDGLAIMTLVGRPDYDNVFNRLLLYFDTWWYCPPLYASYGAQLCWRLLEILPPSAGFIDELNAVVKGGDMKENSIHHRIIYLLVFFDRLRRLPTSFTSSSTTGGNPDKETKLSKHRIEAIANETFKAQSSRQIKSVEPTFSSIDGYEAFFSDLRSYKIHLPLLLAEGLNQLRNLHKALNEKAFLLETKLVFWRIIVHVLRIVVSRILVGGRLYTPGEAESSPLTTVPTTEAKSASSEPLKVCSTGTQSSSSVGPPAEVAEDLLQKDKKPDANPELSYFLDSFLQLAVDMMQCLLQHLRAEVRFSHGGVVERLCPERLVASAIESSLLLNTTTIGRLTNALRNASSHAIDEEDETGGARLYAWKNLLQETGSLDWTVSRMDTLSQIVCDRFTNAAVETVSAPRSVLIGYLLKEISLFANALVHSPRDTVTSAVFLSYSEEELTKTLTHLSCLQFNPLASTLGIDLSDVLHFYVARIKTRTKLRLERVTEDFIFDSLVCGLMNETSKDLREQIFAYLEVATSLPRVIRRCINGDLPLFMSVHKSPVSTEYLRLFCLILMRAINPPSNVDIYTGLAEQALYMALNDKVIISAVTSVLNGTNNEGEPVLQPPSQLYCLLVERVLRLIAAPWSGADRSKQQCLESLLDVIDQCVTECPTRGHFIISGLRCLLLAPWNKSPTTHVRFTSVLARWAQLARSRSLRTERAETKNDFVLTLCAIYDYLALLLRAFAPHTVVEDANLALPDALYIENRNRSAVDEFTNPEIAKFFTFFTNLPTENNNYYLKPGSAWNSALDAYLHYALCGPAAGRTTVVPHLLSTLPFHQYAFSPLERSCEEVCTFPSTQHQYIHQPWYGCNTCGIVANHGSCHLCAKVCHRGHDLVYQSTSEFFCDCAAEMGEMGKCHSILRRMPNSGDGLLVNLQPWLNVACFQRSVYDSACDLILKAASRRPPANVEAIQPGPPRHSLSPAVPTTNTNNTAGPIVTAPPSTAPVVNASAAPALPPRNSEWITAESGSSDTNIINRFRRTGAFRRRPGLVASKSVSREGGSGTSPISAASAPSQPPISLLPSLSLIYGLSGVNGRKRFNLWTVDRATPRRRAVEAFQRKWGSRPQPPAADLVNRLRTQMSHLSESEKESILNILKSSALFTGVESLLDEVLHSLLLLTEESLKIISQRVTASEEMRSSAIQHLISANREVPHRVLLSSRLVTLVFFFNYESSVATSAAVAEVSASTAVAAFEFFQSLSSPSLNPSQSASNIVPAATSQGLPQPAVTVPDSTVTSTDRQRRTATDLSSIHLWIADAISSRRGHHLFNSSITTTPPGTTVVEARADHLSGNDIIATLTRVPSVEGWRHYLLVAMPLSSSPVPRSREEGLVNILRVDDLFVTASKCQETLETATVSPDLGTRDMSLPTSSSSSSPEGLFGFVLHLSALPLVSKINCGFEITQLSPHPTNEAIFTASNSHTCVVFGLSTLGQACGRVTINPLMGNKEELVIKPVWLPGTSRFIAVLTTKSVQVFDIFANSPKLLYYFKPVEGNFSDATFIHIPRRRKGKTNDEELDGYNTGNYDFSNVILVVMATFGSMMLQRLLPTTRVSQGHFYLAESLEWGTGTGESADIDVGAASLESLRNPNTGTFAEGGVSVFYASSLQLLLHSYNSGHTFASAIGFSDDGAMKVNHSFTLTGAKDSASSTTSSSSVGPRPREPTNNGLCDGPLHAWAEVPNHLGFLTATGFQPPTGGNSGCAKRRNVLIAVEPDTVWMQPLPVEAPHVLPKSPDETPVSTVNTSPKPEGNTGGGNLASSLIAASLTKYWDGDQNHPARLFTLQISRYGTIQVFAGPPESEIIDKGLRNQEEGTFLSKCDLPLPLPGQFWLHPALLYREEQKTAQPMSQNSPVPLEDLLLWQVSASMKAPGVSKPDSATVRDFTNYALSALPALRILLERDGTGSQPPLCDFHEWSSTSDNVTFYSRDLMSIYNHETLNQRLRKENMAVTFSGCNLTCPSRPASSKKVAFVVDIETTRPAEEVIVGVRVELTETCRPQFISIFGRIFTLDGDRKTKKRQTMFVDLPLTLSEILQVGSGETLDKDFEPLRLYVGQSLHSDTLTSIDRILVYTVPRALIDPAFLISPDDTDALNQKSTRLYTLLSLNNKTMRIVLYNTSLVKWFDRLMATGFVTSIAKPPPQSRQHPCEFTTPVYDNAADVNACLVATLTDFFRSANAFTKGIVTPIIEKELGVLTMALNELLPEAFVDPHGATTHLVTNLISLHASGGNEALTADIISPRYNLKRLFHSIENILICCRSHPSIAACSRPIIHLSRVWRLSHEYDGSTKGSLPGATIIQLFNYLREMILLLEERLPPQLPPKLNSLWVTFLQALTKVAVFVLAESYLSLFSPSPVSSVGDLISRLLTHAQSQIACNMRDILCTTLVCLFSGNHRIAKHFFDPSPFPQNPGGTSQLPLASSPNNEEGEEEEEAKEEGESHGGADEKVNDDDDDNNTVVGGEGGFVPKNAHFPIGNIRLRRIRRPRLVPKRQGNLTPISLITFSTNNNENSSGGGGGGDGGVVTDSSLEEIGRNLNEMLQFIASTTSILDDEDVETDGDEENDQESGGGGIARDSRRPRWDSAHPRYQSLREAVDEFRLNFGSRRGGRQPAPLALDPSDPIRFMDELSEFDDEVLESNRSGLQVETETRYVFVEEDDSGQGATNEEAEAADAESPAGEEESDEEDDEDADEDTENSENKSDNSEGEVEPAPDGSDHNMGLARDIFQYVVDLFSNRCAETPNESTGPDVTKEAAEAPRSSDVSLPFVGSGCSSSGNDVGSGDSIVMGVPPLEDVDDEALLNLLLQSSIHGQRSPGAAALMDSKADQFTISPTSTNVTTWTPAAASMNASNSGKPTATTATKSTVSTQVLSSNKTVSGVDRKTSQGSGGSDLSEGLLLNLFDDMDVAPTVFSISPTSSCASWSLSSDLDSSDEDDGGDSNPPPSPPSEPSDGASDLLPRDRQSLLAARACIVLTRHLISSWQSLMGWDENAESAVMLGDSKNLIPLMQTLFTFCRLLEAIAQWSELPETNEELREIADAAKATLADLVRVLSTSLLSLHEKHQQKQSDSSPDTTRMLTPISERLLLVTNLLSLVLTVSPTPAAFDTTHPRGGIGGNSVASPTALLVGRDILHEPGDPGSGDSLFVKCMNSCLSIVESLYTKRERSHSWPLGENMSSSAAPTPTVCRVGSRIGESSNLPQLTTGLLQCAYGVNFSSLTNGFGVGLTNCAPILDAQASLTHLLDPLRVDLDVHLTEAAVRLAIAFTTGLRTGDSKRDNGIGGSAEREELKKKWCALMYNFLESLTLSSPHSESFSTTVAFSDGTAPTYSKPNSSTPATARLADLMRSLLILLVGPKHHRQLKDIHLLSQTLVRMRCVYERSLTQEGDADPTRPSPLPYPIECVMLNYINSCLDVALSNRSTWQRLCIRKSDDLLFLLEASLHVRDILALGLLTLVLVAILPDSQHAASTTATPNAASASTAATATTATETSGPSGTNYGAKLVGILTSLLLSSDGEGGVKDSSTFLLNFVLGNICCRANQRIRCTATLILSTLVQRSKDDAFAMALLKHMPRLWSELPSFSLYGEDFAYLSLILLRSHPQWPGLPSFCGQVIHLLLSQLDGLAKHPCRDMYKAVLQAFSVNGITPGPGHYLESPQFAGLHLPATFLSSTVPGCYSGTLTSNLIGFSFDSEPCLPCNRSLFSSLPYLSFQWNSSTPSRRRGNNSNTSAISGLMSSTTVGGSTAVPSTLYPTPTYILQNRFTSPPHVATYAQASTTGNASVDTPAAFQLTSTTNSAPSVIDLEPPTWVSPNVHIFSLLDTWEIARIAVRFLAPAPGLRSVRTLNIFTSDAFECPPSRLMQARHLWRRLVQVDIPLTKYNVVVHLAAETDSSLPSTKDAPSDPSTTVEIRLSDGLPLTANSLIFHYAAFHGADEGEEGGDVGAEGQGQRRSRRRHCCRCNVPILLGSTCQNCKQSGNQCSRCLFINLSDEEVFLCTKCGSSNYNFMNFSMLARPNFFHVGRLRDEEDRRVALARIVSLTEELSTQLAALEPARRKLLNPVHVDCPPPPRPQEIPVPLCWPRDQILKIMTDIEHVQHAAAPTAFRLWALRQAVALYDGRCGADCPDFVAPTDSAGSDDRCLRCVEAALSLIVTVASNFSPSHFSVGTRRECIKKGLALVHGLCPVVQTRLLSFLHGITYGSIPLINEFNDNIVERLLAMSQYEEAIFDFERSTYFDVSLLERSVESLISKTLPFGVEADRSCQEARLRAVFRLLLALQQQQKKRNEGSAIVAPPTTITACIYAHCVRALSQLFTPSDRVRYQWRDREFPAFRPPRANFTSWIRGDEAATFSTWRPHYDLAVKTAEIEERVRKNIDAGTASRDLLLSARFFLRWWHRTAQAKLPPLASRDPNESTITPGAWLTPLLFHCLASRSYMPHQDFGLEFFSNLCHDTINTSTNRLAECLCYLTSQCMPHFDRILCAARGSGLADEPTRINRMVLLMWDLSSGGITASTLVLNRTQRSSCAFVPSSTTAASASGAQTRTNGTEPLTPLIMRPLLLYRGRFLDQVGVVLQRTLATLSALEGVDGGGRASLPSLRNWTDCLPSQLAPVSGSSATPGSNPGYTLMHISDLLAILQPLHNLAPEHQHRLYSYLIYAIVSLQPVVYQRSIFIVKAEQLFKELLQQLMQNSASLARDFILITMDYLDRCPVETDDQSSAVFLLKRICACACPLPTEIAPFPVRIAVWRDQEEYLFVRRVREVVMSNTRGFGPTISDVINYICAENNLTTDMRLEVVCENTILMPQLLLEDVYKYLWLQNPNNANTAMELIYRIPGLESDNLPYVSRLPHPAIPEEQYSRLAVITEHPRGLAIILNRMATVRDALKCHDLLRVCAHLLEYCLKVPQCQGCLVDPQFRAIPILLDALYICLQVMHQSTGDFQVHFHDQVTARLVAVLTTLLQSATTTTTASDDDDDSLGLPRLLSCLAMHPDLEVVQSGVAKLPGLLAFGAEPRMTAIVEFLRQYAVLPLRMDTSQSDETGRSINADLLQCCCALVTAIPHNTLHGRRLRARLVYDLVLLDLCVAYLWRMIPSEMLDQPEENALDTKGSALSTFLNDVSLPFVLQLLRGCVWAVADAEADPPTPPFPAAPAGHSTRQLLAFLHKLEDSKSVGRVGLLSEDLLDEWVAAGSSGGASSPGDADLATIPGVVATIEELRALSEQRHRRNAKVCREKYLLSLNMKVNEKGQVAMTTASKLAEMAAQVVEETGLQCAICHEGPRSAPREELGIYAFIRRCRLEEPLTDAASSSTASVAAVQTSSSAPDASVASEGYTTVSSFVVVHFECHLKAVRTSTQSEWSVATRHNRDALCNCLLPVLMNDILPEDREAAPGKEEKKEKDAGQAESQGGGGESMDDLYAKRLSALVVDVTMLVSLSMSVRLAVHDIKLLLLRFAHQRSFHGETGGGARESNLNLIPHLMQVTLFQMKKEQSVETERTSLMEMLERPESYWASACWEATGPLYSAVLALHLLPRTEWLQHRATLLRHLMALAHARATSGSPPFAVYKPYLLFFGLIEGFYVHFFKNVQPPDEGPTGCWWPDAVSRYIRRSDEQLLAATPGLLSFFEEDLSPVESVDEFLDVVEMIGEVDVQELVNLATTGSR